jgi:hypothetical protein
MANCSLLLNDGSYLLLNDGTSRLLLNDNSCSAVDTEGALSAPCTVTASFVGGSLSADPVPFTMTGTASVLFVSPPVVAPEEYVSPITTGAGGALAWNHHRREDEGKKRRRVALLALIRASDDYRRLRRKLAMLQEHLLDARGRVETVTVREKIAEIEDQIEMMERLD